MDTKIWLFVIVTLTIADKAVTLQRRDLTCLTCDNCSGDEEYAGECVFMYTSCNPRKDQSCGLMIENGAIMPKGCVIQKTCRDNDKMECCSTNLCNRDYCEPSPCTSGDCIPSLNSQGFRCDCQPGEQGNNCQAACELGMTGDDCDITDPCHANPCNDGECILSIVHVARFWCKCETGVTGDRCENPNPCIPNPCSGNKDKPLCDVEDGEQICLPEQ